MNVAARTRHLFLAVGGLLGVGAGLSLFGDALARKIEADRRGGAGLPRPWFWRGTLSLALVNAGICLVVEAGKTER